MHEHAPRPFEYGGGKTAIFVSFESAIHTMTIDVKTKKAIVVSDISFWTLPGEKPGGRPIIDLAREPSIVSIELDGEVAGSERVATPGDHSWARTDWIVSVSCTASPPCLDRVQTWVLPLSLDDLPLSLDDRNESDLPSGLHRGCDEDCFFAVIGNGSPPAAGTIHTRVSELSSSRLLLLTVYAIQLPSGLI